MKDSNQPGNDVKQNKSEEDSTRSFPIVTEEDQATADSFEMKKRDKDGKWVDAAPVHVTDDTAPQTEKPSRQVPEEQKSQPQERADEQPTEPLRAAAWTDAAPITEQADEDDAVVDEDVRVRTPRRPSRGKRVAIAIGSVAAVAVAGFSIFVYTYPNIFPGVRVADSYKLGGMTQQQAQEYISNDVQDAVFSSSITVTGKDLGADTEKTYTIDIEDVADSLDSEASVAQAYQIGREGGYFQRVGTVINSLVSGWDVSLNATLEDDVVSSKVVEIYSDLSYQPVQPSWEVDKENSQLNISTGKQGLGFKMEKVAEDISAKIQTINFEPYEIETYLVNQNKPNAAEIAEDVNSNAQNAGVDKSDGTTIIEAVDGVQVEESTIVDTIGDASEESYTVPVTVTKATVTAAELSGVLFRDRLASVTTNYNGSQAARTTNVRLAANSCDNVILNPGEEFSYNDIVGERTASRGYRSAIIFQEGQEVNGLGGGICQVSSTIYMAVLRADLEVSERYNHQFQVSYTPIAQDATVAYGSKDFKFVNDTNYPVQLRISMGGGRLSVEIFGTKTDDRSVSLSSRSYVSGSYRIATLYKTVTINGESTTNRENRSSYLLN